MCMEGIALRAETSFMPRRPALVFRLRVLGRCGIALPLGPEVLTTSLTDVRRNRASTAGDQLWWPTG